MGGSEGGTYVRKEKFLPVFYRILAFGCPKNNGQYREVVSIMDVLQWGHYKGGGLLFGGGLDFLGRGPRPSKCPGPRKWLIRPRVFQHKNSRFSNPPALQRAVDCFNAVLLNELTPETRGYMY